MSKLAYLALAIFTLGVAGVLAFPDGTLRVVSLTLQGIGTLALVGVLAAMAWQDR